MESALVIGTRNSRLALWQATRVNGLLKKDGISAELEEIVTRGDRVQDVPMSQMRDESIFTKELDIATLEGRIDLAVHSLKDLPSSLPDGLILAAVSARAEPFDAFVAHPSFSGGMAELPRTARIATSALRRRAQLKAWMPDLEVVPVRGNVDTRIEKLDESDWHGMVLAAAGLVRMGISDRITERIDPDIMVPAVGQGALGIVCRATDEELIERLQQAIQEPDARLAADAERAFMKQIGGGCQVPTGAWATLDSGGQLTIRGCVAGVDGTPVFRNVIRGPQAKAAELGRDLAVDLLDRGADDILEDMGVAPIDSHLSERDLDV